MKIPLLLFIFLICSFCHELSAKTLFCKGYCKVGGVLDTEILVSQLDGKLGLVTDLRTYWRNPTSTDFARRIHPHAMCYMEFDHHLKFDLLGLPDHQPGYGICRVADGTFWVGDLYNQDTFSKEITPYAPHGVISIYDAAGVLDGVYKYSYGRRKDRLPREKSASNSIFVDLRSKLESDCWYGDCENGFGIKLSNLERHTLDIGDWSQGNRYSSYDRLGNLKSKIITYSVLTEVINSLTDIYSEPQVVKTGWCFFGDCRTNYGVLLSRNGDLYKGFFKRGKFDGAGKLVRQNRTSHTGEWLSGEPHGQGEEFDGIKVLLKGNFYYGEKSGNFTLFGNGWSQEVLYKKDEVVATGDLIRE